MIITLEGEQESPNKFFLSFFDKQHSKLIPLLFWLRVKKICDRIMDKLCI